MPENDIPLSSPLNDNFAAKDTWTMVISRVPNTTFFCQRVTLPGLNLGEARQANIFNPIPQPGSNIQFDDLSVTFKLDEDYANWRELYNWMLGISNMKDFAKYAAYDPLGGAPFADITLNLQTNQRNPNMHVFFRNAWPTSLQSLDLDYSGTEHEVNECTVSFKFSHFDIQFQNEETT